MNRRRALLFLAGLPSGLLRLQSARAEERTQKVARVGFVGPDSLTSRRGVGEFWKHMRELGWVEGRNVVIEVRWADGQIDRLPVLMNELLAHNVDVIVTYSTPGALAAKSATRSVPIVVASMGDPVGTGLVTSLARPGGNLTGLSQAQTAELSGKWLELLQETVPHLSTVAVISNPDSLYVRKASKDLAHFAQVRRLKLRFIDVREPGALAKAFVQARRQAQAGLVLADPLTVTHRQEITALAASNHLPTLYALLDFVDAGGMMAYGVDSAILFRRSADYVDKILNGAHPGDLPIEQPTEYQLIVNLQAAKALGLTFPESILLMAAEVIK